MVQPQFQPSNNLQPSNNPPFQPSNNPNGYNPDQQPVYVMPSSANQPQQYNPNQNQNMNIINYEPGFSGSSRCQFCNKHTSEYR